MKIITNNIPRQLIYGYELTEEEKKEFDYIPEDEIYGHDFFRYKGNIYDPSEFMRIENNPELKDWECYSSDTYFSGVLIKYTQDKESVIVGCYFG